MLIKVSKSYIAAGKIHSSQYECSTKDWNGFVKDRIFDAEMLAENAGGHITYIEEPNSLYISYLDVPNISKIDALYLKA